VPLVHFALAILEMGVTNYSLTSKHSPPDLSLPSS
jgi:hypothetical protein